MPHKIWTTDQENVYNIIDLDSRPTQNPNFNYIFQLIFISLQIEGVCDPVKLQMCANSIALMARQLSFDSKFLSPFSINARKNNINAIGGKPDDVTVVLATVSDNSG